MNRALCIGINDYPGTNSDLNGCVNDAYDWASELQKRGFITTTILDGQCSKANMIYQIQKIISEARPGDITVITYSGHGTWVPDTSGDEDDGRDEGLCPWDISKGQILLDDELDKLFRAIQPGAKLVFISDSCHSGTVSRGFLPWDKHQHPVGDDCISETVNKRYLDTQEFLTDDIMNKGWKTSPSINLSDDVAVFFSGCSDIEYSYDANFNGKANGAFTYVALNALKVLPEDATYEDWYNEIRKTLPQARYPQTPKFSGTDTQRNWKIFKI